VSDEDKTLVRLIREAKARLNEAERLLSAHKVPLSGAQSVLAGFDLIACRQSALRCLQKLPKAPPVPHE
jgi:hypothetical protein